MRCVPFDSNYRVRIDKMEAEIIKCRAEKTAIIALIGVAGATETGSIDDLTAIAGLAKKYGIHLPNMAGTASTSAWTPHGA
jgi:glutamate decarboxylase